MTTKVSQAVYPQYAYQNINNNGQTVQQISPAIQNFALPQTQSTPDFLGTLGQLNQAAPQGQQGPMEQLMQMFLQMMTQIMGGAPQNQQQAQNPLTNTPPQNATLPQTFTPTTQPQNSQGFPVAKQTATTPQNSQGFPVAKNGSSAAAAASASAGKGGASASASASAGKGGASAAASASASADGKKDIKSMSNDELEKYHKEAKGKEKAEVSKEKHRRKAEGNGKMENGKEMTDPYEVNIDGEKYVFVKDKNKNGQIDNEQEFLGASDSKDNLFKEMKELDTNKDGKVSKDEMDAQGVKLQKVDKNGKLTNQSKDVNNVDVNSFQKNGSFNGAGNAGSFNMQLADGRQVTGNEVFETLEKLKSYFA